MRPSALLVHTGHRPAITIADRPFRGAGAREQAAGSGPLREPDAAAHDGSRRPRVPSLTPGQRAQGASLRPRFSMTCVLVEFLHPDATSRCRPCADSDHAPGPFVAGPGTAHSPSPTGVNAIRANSLFSAGQPLFRRKASGKFGRLPEAADRFSQCATAGRRASPSRIARRACPKASAASIASTTISG